MIVTTVNSGLGNQMFQYAAGFALARRRGTSLHVDARSFETDRYRPFELRRLAVTARPLTRRDRLRMRFSVATAPRVRPDPLAVRPVRAVLHALPVHRFAWCTDAGQAFADDYRTAGDFTVLRGYWQNEAYFADAAAELRRQFAFRHPPADAENARLLAEIVRPDAPPAVCVHVRRGDYLSGKEVLSAAAADYYQAALAHVRGRVPDARLFVFGDDPDWARAHLPVGPGATFVTHNLGRNDPEDLRLMAACRHFVIANSTFSWWAAWLSAPPADGQVVVAPARWYAVPHPNEAVIVPDRWTRLG